MRLSLLSDDNEIADLLINKALELLSQADTAAQADERERAAQAAGACRPSIDPSDTH
jgi:hypothetical protein